VQRIKDKPPRKMFDPPRANAGLFEVFPFAPKLRLRLEQFNGLPHRIVPPPGHVHAGVRQQPIHFLLNVEIELRTNDDIHRDTGWPDSKRLTAR